MQFNEAHTRWRTQYERALTAFDSGAGSITNGLEYVREFDADTSPDAGSPLAAWLETVPLYAFYRCYTYNDQEISFIGANPRLSFQYQRYKDEDAFIQHRLGPHPEAMVEHCRHRLGSWLSDAKGYHHLAPLLASETDIIDAGPNKQHFSDYAHHRFFDDVYYTNWYKFATSSTAELPSWDSDVATPILVEELQAVDPELIVPIGGDLWEELLDVVAPVADGPITNGITTVHGHLYEFTDAIGIDSHVLPLVHISSRWPSNCPSDSAERIRNSLTQISTL